MRQLYVNFHSEVHLWKLELFKTKQSKFCIFLIPSLDMCLLDPRISWHCVLLTWFPHTHSWLHHDEVSVSPASSSWFVHEPTVPNSPSSWGRERLLFVTSLGKEKWGIGLKSNATRVENISYITIKAYILDYFYLFVSNS